MENSDLIATVENKAESCKRMYIRTQKNPDGCSEEQKAEWLERWKTSMDFWEKCAESCRKIGCIGGKWIFCKNTYDWRIYAENGDLFFAVNEKRMPMKRINHDFIYQMRKRTVNYSNLESTVRHFLETTMDEHSAMQFMTEHVFQWIEQYGK